METVKPDRIRGGLTKLKGIGGSQGGPMRREMSIAIGKELVDIEFIYEMVEKDRDTRRIFVIDSIDALAERYGLDPNILITSLQKDLVEGYGQNLLYVLESPEPLLDYLGDGVVVMDRSEVDRRRVREIELLKLRGCEISRPRYLFTLRNGKMMTFNLDVTRKEATNSQWSAIADTDGKVSSGMPDLDRLIGGGIERGSIVLIELGQSVPLHVAESIERSLVANFIMLNRGVLWFPSRRVSAETVRAHMAEIVPREKFEKQVRVPEVASQVELSAQFIMPVEGANAGVDLKWKNVSYMLGGGEQPYLSLLGFDTLESVYGEKVMDQIMDHLGAMKKNKGVAVCVTSKSTKSTSRLSDIASVHIKVDRVGGTTIVYGERPFTECNAITFEADGAIARAYLTPVV
jgi:3-dehydroquinate dehydratase